MYNTNLVNRYWIDAGSGITLTDSAGTDNLTLSGAGYSWNTTTPSHTAVDFVSNTNVAKVSMSGSGTLTALNGVTQYTVELVVDLTNWANTDSFIAAIHAGGNYAPFALYGNNGTSGITYFDISGGGNITFDYNLEGAGRKVIHFVYDSTQAVASDRVKLFVDDVQQTTTGSPNWPTQNATVTISASDYLAFGNRENGSLGVNGAVHYAAIYSEAMATVNITNNYTELTTASDEIVINPILTDELRDAENINSLITNETNITVHVYDIDGGTELYTTSTAATDGSGVFIIDDDAIGSVGSTPFVIFKRSNGQTACGTMTVVDGNA